MLISCFICQTDLKLSSVTNDQNGTITPSRLHSAGRANLGMLWVLLLVDLRSIR